MNPKIGLSLLKKMVSITVNFPDLTHYKVIYDVKKRSTEFEVFYTENDSHTYPLNQTASEQLAELIDNAINGKIKEGVSPHFVNIDHNDEKIEVVIYYQEDGKKLKQIINL